MSGVGEYGAKSAGSSDPYQRLLGKTSAEIVAAQHRLVDMTISQMIETCLETASSPLVTEFQTTLHGQPVVVDLKNAQGDACSTADEVEEAIRQYGDEASRVRVCNKFARVNGLDISIKTSGCKSAESAERKASRRHFKEPLKELLDVARLTVVSGDPKTLDTFSEKLQQDILEDAAEKNIRSDMEPTNMRSKGRLEQTLKTEVHGIGTEVQFLARQIARVADPLTHVLYESARILDEWQHRPFVYEARKEEFIDGYNQIAQLVTELSWRSEAVSKTYLDHVNKVFAHQYMLVDDAQSEKSQSPEQPKAAHYKPYLFRDIKDLEQWQQGIKGAREELDLFPMSPLDPEKLTRTTLENAALRLKTLTQLTYACYMKDAPEPMRELWVEHALKNNAAARSPSLPKIFDTPVMPQSLIDMVAARKIDPYFPEKQTHAR